MTASRLLESINSPADLRRLDRKQLPQLATELRAFLIAVQGYVGRIDIEDQFVGADTLGEPIESAQLLREAALAMRLAARTFAAGMTAPTG